MLVLVSGGVRLTFPKAVIFTGATPEQPRLLLSRLGPLEAGGPPRSLTEVRLHELFGPVLHTEAVDSDDDEAAWVETILGSTADFFAVTRGRQFVNLVPRQTALNAVLLALTHGS